MMDVAQKGQVKFPAQSLTFIQLTTALWIWNNFTQVVRTSLFIVFLLILSLSVFLKKEKREQEGSNFTLHGFLKGLIKSNFIGGYKIHPLKS